MAIEPSDASSPGSAESPEGEVRFEDTLQSVRRAIEVFTGCSAEERQLLTAEIDQLRAMAEKLETGRVEIVVVGEISTGKSALINALVGRAVTSVHVRGGWTKEVGHAHWEANGYSVPGLGRSQVVLVDTPGLNEVDGAERAELARKAAARADLVLFVVDSDLNDTEYAALEELLSASKPVVVVVNKMDLYSAAQRQQLLDVLRSRRLAGRIEPENLIPAAADPRPVEFVTESADGSVRSQWRRPEPDVGSLRARILEVLARDGKALVALNGAMYAADTSDRIAAIRVRFREEKAAKTIWGFAVTKSVAVAVTPLPAADVIAGSAVDVVMVATLARVYGIQMTTAHARSLVDSILRAAGWVLLGEAVTHVAASLFKGLTLGYGTVLTALPQGAAAGYASYIVGQAARYYFQHGASWGRESPKVVVGRILDATDKESILTRLKQEIREKIRLNPYADRAG
jgi:small GTP-binding protein